MRFLSVSFSLASSLAYPVPVGVRLLSQFRILSPIFPSRSPAIGSFSSVGLSVFSATLLSLVFSLLRDHSASLSRSLSLFLPPSLSRSWIWTRMEDACAGRSLTRVHTTTHHVGIRPPDTFPERVSLEYPRRNHAITSHERRLFRRLVAQPDDAFRSMAFQRGEENRRDPRWRCRFFFCYKTHATSHDAHRQP